MHNHLGRQNNFGQTGACYRAMEDWECNELISNEGLGVEIEVRPTAETAGALK